MLKTRTTLLTLLLIFIFSFLTACSDSGSDTAQSIISKQADVTVNYTNGLANAKSAEDVVKAVEEFTQGMKVLMPEYVKFREKYPNFKSEGVPAAIKNDIKRLEAASLKMQEAMMNAMKYMMDPKVQTAMTKMGEEMQNMESQFKK